MTKSYVKKVSFKLFLEGVEVRCRTQCSRKFIPTVRTSEQESSFFELGTESGFDVHTKKYKMLLMCIFITRYIFTILKSATSVPVSLQFLISGQACISCLAAVVVCIVVEEVNLNRVKTRISEITVLVLEHQVVDLVIKSCTWLLSLRDEVFYLSVCRYQVFVEYSHVNIFQLYHIIVFYVM